MLTSPGFNILHYNLLYYLYILCYAGYYERNVIFGIDLGRLGQFSDSLGALVMKKRKFGFEHNLCDYVHHLQISNIRIVLYMFN